MEMGGTARKRKNPWNFHDLSYVLEKNTYDNKYKRTKPNDEKQVISSFEKLHLNGHQNFNRKRSAYLSNDDELGGEKGRNDMYSSDFDFTDVSLASKKRYKFDETTRHRPSRENKDATILNSDMESVHDGTSYDNIDDDYYDTLNELLQYDGSLEDKENKSSNDMLHKYCKNLKQPFFLKYSEGFLPVGSYNQYNDNGNLSDFLLRSIQEKYENHTKKSMKNDQQHALVVYKPPKCLSSFISDAMIHQNNNN